MENWREIWERKGKEPTKDLRILDGSERHPIGLDKKIVSGIIKRMNLLPSERILEVGCGAGMLAQHFTEYNYYGIDLSKSLVKKHQEIVGGNPIVASANSLPFKEGSFDAVFSFGVFLYFPNKYYALQTIKEMRRVAKSPKKVYIGDLAIESHRNSHLLFQKREFYGTFFESFWLKENPNEERFDVILNDSSECYKPL